MSLEHTGESRNLASISDPSMSLDFENQILLDKEGKENTGTMEGFSCYIMNIKSLVGIGIFILFQCVKHVGFLGFAIIYAIITLLFMIFIASMMHVANKVGYFGNR